MPDLVPLRRALISVSDKTGIVDFARGLASLGVELVSTGGTAKSLSDAGLAVIPVESLTGFPEMMDGRVKTLHPAIHGGILALRDDDAHIRAMHAHAINPIDLVCINLYPFEQTVARPAVSRADAIENIDVGGPAMIRAAAKNHDWVAVLTSPAQYDSFLAEVRRNAGSTTLATRSTLAAAAFTRTAQYDTAIAHHLGATASAVDRGGAPTTHDFPDTLTLTLHKRQSLRYGENPHQSAALYADPDHRGPSVVSATQLHGKELSYNNLNDAAAALALAIELAALDRPGAAAAIIKHANPCGSGVAHATADAVALALKGDPIAAYGGIIALAAPLDADAARVLTGPNTFFEVIIAPAFAPDALAVLRAKSANVRILQFDKGPEQPADAMSLRTIPGGALVQSQDTRPATPAEWRHRAGPPPAAETLQDAAVVWTIAKHLSSNAIAIGGRDNPGIRLFGAGAGQMDRVTACRLAIEKAGPLARGAIAASDAFFPFPDGPELLIRAGITTIIHPGGSKRDQETFDLCEQHAVTCLTTGVRHFRH